MTATPCPQNIWNHTDGCTCAPNGSVTAEADLTLATDTAPASSAVGDCPDCGQPMIGHANDGKFVPGAECEHCHHTVAAYEKETEPDEDGRTFLYSIDEYAYVRITDDDGDTVAIYEPSDGVEWETQVAAEGFDPAALTRAALAVNDRHAFVEEEARRAGYAHLGGPYSILLDRERVPAHALIARASDPEALAEDDEDIEYAIDKMYDAVHHYETGEEYEIGPADWKRVEQACHEAGLGSMKDIYESMANREILNTGHVVDDVTVTNDYERHVGPAIDRIEDRLLAAHGDVQASAEPETEAGVEHNFAGWRKVPSRRGGLKSPKCSCGWEGGPQHAVEGLKSFEAHQVDPDNA